VTGPGPRPAVGDETPGWPRAILRGFLVFMPIAAVGLVAALATFLFADPGVSLAGALRIGALYLGPFHHVALVIEGDLDVDVSRLPGSSTPIGGSATVELGVALLAVMALAVWLLFRAGRASGFGDGPGARALSGSVVALGYAPPVLLVALLVRFEEPVELGSSLTGGVGVSMSTWQALAFPLAIATLGGGWLMFLLGLGLSYLGLFVAGIVQPDEPVATATPSTARYFSTVFERPGQGAVILAHHLALAPNEALWTLVPAVGGCDVVRGSDRAELLCYRRFPSGATPDGDVSFGNAPGGYLAFLLVPALATLVGGRWAGSTAKGAGTSGAAIGAASGFVFGVAVFAGCLLASITLSYGTTSGAGSGGGHLWIGPDPVSGTLFALAWGLIGGAVGGASTGFRRPKAERQPAG